MVLTLLPDPPTPEYVGFFSIRRLAHTLIFGLLPGKYQVPPTGTGSSLNQTRRWRASGTRSFLSFFFKGVVS